MPRGGFDWRKAFERQHGHKPGEPIPLPAPAVEAADTDNERAVRSVTADREAATAETRIPSPPRAPDGTQPANGLPSGDHSPDPEIPAGSPASSGRRAAAEGERPAAPRQAARKEAQAPSGRAQTRTAPAPSAAVESAADTDPEPPVPEPEPLDGTAIVPGFGDIGAPLAAGIEDEPEGTADLIPAAAEEEPEYPVAVLLGATDWQRLLELARSTHRGVDELAAALIHDVLEAEAAA